MSRLIALALLGACLVAAETDPLADEPVAVVNGEAITLRHLEDEMLQKEGVDLMMELVQRSLVDLAWEKLPVDATLVQVGRYRITREVLAAELLRNDAANVRKDMIDLLLVEQELRREGIVLTEVVLDRELARIEAAFEKQLVEQGQPRIAFPDYLQQKEGLTIEQFKRDPAFRMLTGLHLLVFRHTEVPEDELKRYFHAHPAQFQRDEQLDLSLIYIPFPERARNDPLAKEGPRGVLQFIYGQIQAGKTTFAEQFKAFGRGHDPDADAQGRIGWVGPAGERGKVGARKIPKYVMQILFATNREQLPVLLKPLETEDGMYLFRLHGHREAFRPEFEEARDLVRTTLIEDRLQAFTDAMRRRLRRDAKIDYKDLPPLVRAREERVRKKREAEGNEAEAEEKAQAD